MLVMTGDSVERVADIGYGMMWKVIRYQVIESEHLMLEAALSVPTSEPCLDVGHGFLLLCPYTCHRSFGPSLPSWRLTPPGMTIGYFGQCNSPGLLDCVAEGMMLNEEERV